jgi:hypothetical protein
VRSRVMIMVALATVSIAAAAIYVVGEAVDARNGGSETTGPTLSGAAALAAVSSHKPYIVFRHVSRDDPTRYGMIALAPADDVGAAVVTGQVCSRVYYVTAGGFCIDVAGALGVARRGWILGSARLSLQTRLGSHSNGASETAPPGGSPQSTCALAMSANSRRRRAWTTRWSGSTTRGSSTAEMAQSGSSQPMAVGIPNA